MLETGSIRNGVYIIQSEDAMLIDPEFHTGMAYICGGNLHCWGNWRKPTYPTRQYF